MTKATTSGYPVISRPSFVLVAVLVLMSVASGCSSGKDDQPGSTPAATETQEVQPTATSTPLERRLTTSAAEDIFPAWSPDSGHIAFSSNFSGRFEILVMKSDGTDVSKLTTTQAGQGSGSPAWSPDGTKIAWDDGNEIYVMNADGTAQTRLTNDQFGDSHPSWSPDGKRIVFWTFRDNDWEIYTMNAVGSGNADGSGDLLRLTHSPGSDSQPAWSPDGDRIAFVSYRDGNLEIYSIGKDGSGTIRLTNDAANDSEPAWSPDGTQITFTSERDGNAEIYIMNADGSGLSRLTQNPADERSPSWSLMALRSCMPPIGTATMTFMRLT